MCLAIPGKVVEWIRRDPPFTEAWVEFGGTRRRVNLSLVTGIDIDHYVLVHAGVAIQKVNETEAEQTLQLLSDIESHLEDDASFGRSGPHEAS